MIFMVCKQAGKQLSQQAGKQATRQASKQASKDSSKQESKQVVKQASTYLEGILSEPCPVGACYKNKWNTWSSLITLIHHFIVMIQRNRQCPVLLWRKTSPVFQASEKTNRNHVSIQFCTWSHVFLLGPTFAMGGSLLVSSHQNWHWVRSPKSLFQKSKLK